MDSDSQCIIKVIDNLSIIIIVDKMLFEILTKLPAIKKKKGQNKQFIFGSMGKINGNLNYPFLQIIYSL